MLVEDDNAVRQFAVDILENLGYDVVHSASGQQALRMIKKAKITFDLLITDVIMPEMNGRELADRVKEISPKTSVLLISGYPDNHIGMDGVLDKKYDFMQKPFSVNNFAKKVREVLSRNNNSRG